MILHQVKCVWCNKEITDDEFQNGKANILLGETSHTKCDGEAFARIDKNLKVVKRNDII